jgi:hypothetical protein
MDEGRRTETVKAFIGNMIDLLLLFYVPLKNTSVIWRGHNYRLRATNVDLCSAPRAFDEGGMTITTKTIIEVRWTLKKD